MWGMGISSSLIYFLDLLMGTMDCPTLEQSVVLVYTPLSEEQRNTKDYVLIPDRSVMLFNKREGEGVVVVWCGRLIVHC